LRGVLARLFSATGGAAAVEFAMVLPLLTAFLVGIIEYGGMLIAYDRMHDAVASGAVYVMRGGNDATAIHDVAVSAWPSPPSDAAVTVSQQCTCAGVTASCSSLCADQSYPQSFTSISASGTYTGLWDTKAMSSSQVVRTQ
jgi:Flp pilus assembly protein TadG